MIAAIATFALNAPEWFRLFRLVIVSPVRPHSLRPISGRNFTYATVQIPGDGSDYPVLYRDADAASLREQRKFLATLLANLSLFTVTIALSLVEYPASWFAATQAVMMLITVALSIYLGLKQPQRNWYGTRALAESIKTVTWRFMMRAEPYKGDETSARNHFISNIKKIKNDNQLAVAAVRYGGGDQITQVMQENRRLSLAKRIERYDIDRVGDQLGWYQRKTKSNSDSARVWFCILVAVQLAAVVSAIGRVVSPDFPFWPTDIFVALAGGAIAWLQAKRFQELTASYSLTAHDIALLRAKLPDIGSEKSFSDFVGDAENAFSREHTQWRARRDVD